MLFVWNLLKHILQNLLRQLDVYLYRKCIFGYYPSSMYNLHELVFDVSHFLKNKLLFKNYYKSHLFIL